MSTRLRITEMGTAATAESVGGTGSPGDVLTRVASPPYDDVEWSTIANIYAPAWAVPNWYLDQVLGNDSNAGTSAAAPLKTGTELRKRLGPYALWSQSVTLTVLQNGLFDCLKVDGLLCLAGAHLDVIGIPTLVWDAGTVASYTVLNHATPEASLLTATNVPDWTPFQWFRLRIVGGANDGAVAWVARSNPHALGINVARTSKWTKVSTTSTSTFLQNVTPVVGDHVVVETLPPVPLIAVRVDGPIKQDATAVYPQRQIAIESIDAPAIDAWATGGMFPNRAYTFGCSYTQHQTNVSLANTLIWPILGCFAYSANPSGVVLASGAWVNCLVGRSVTNFNGAVNWTALALLSQAVPVSMTQGVAQNVSDLQVFDCLGATSSAVGISGGLRGTNLSGDGNAGYGIVVFNNSTVRVAGTLNIQAAVTNARFASAPTVNLTLPQFTQPDDYAQKGIATLVGGTVNVVVPWWDPATQRLTFSRNTPAGVIGDLSAPQAARTNTQFTINSSNAGDTSTVDWQISPLGRNLLIATA